MLALVFLKGQAESRPSRSRTRTARSLRIERQWGVKTQPCLNLPRSRNPSPSRNAKPRLRKNPNARTRYAGNHETTFSTRGTTAPASAIPDMPGGCRTQAAQVRSMRNPPWPPRLAAKLSAKYARIAANLPAQAKSKKRRRSTSAQSKKRGLKSSASGTPNIKIVTK